MTPDPARAARLAFIGLLVIGLLTFAGVVIYRVFYAPGEAKRVEVQAKADAGAAKVQAETAKDAIATGDRIVEHYNRVERITRENTIRITAAPGADAPVPPAVAVELDRALGLRDAYRPQQPAAE